MKCKDWKISLISFFFFLVCEISRSQLYLNLIVNIIRLESSRWHQTVLLNLSSNLHGSETMSLSTLFLGSLGRQKRESLGTTFWVCLPSSLRVAFWIVIQRFLFNSCRKSLVSTTRKMYWLQKWRLKTIILTTEVLTWERFMTSEITSLFKNLVHSCC